MVTKRGSKMPTLNSNQPPNWRSWGSYTGPTQWTMSHENPTHADIVLPYYATSDPSTGYKFRAEVTAIPEPSSLLALACGLAGAIVGVRRARRGR